MIYNIILHKRILPFATVRITTNVKRGHDIRFKSKTYRVIDIDGNDIIVSV